MPLKLRPRECIYIALEDLDLTFTLEEVAIFQDEWKRGTPLVEIARMLDRDGDEIAVLAMDQARKGVIQPRPGGAYGNR